MSDEIVVRIRAEGQDKFIKDLKKAGVQVEDTGDKVEKTNKKMGNSFSELGKTIGIAFSVGAIIEFSRRLTKLAVDIDATGAKLSTVFGEATKEIERFGKANATSLGLTVNEYRRAASAIGDLLIPIGFQRKEAAKLTNDLLKLSGALSAWTGGQRTATEVGQIFTKALLGEREQLKELGIDIKEADIKQRLYDKGQQKLTGNALKQAKVLATQELLYERTTDAQAAATDSTQTLAEVQLELGANIRTVAENIAESLIPALTNVGSNVLGAIERFQEFRRRLNDLTTGAGKDAESLRQLRAVIGGLAGDTDEYLQARTEVLEKTAFTLTTNRKLQKQREDERRELIAINELLKARALNKEEILNQLRQLNPTTEEERIRLVALESVYRQLTQVVGEPGEQGTVVRSLEFLNGLLKEQLKLIDTSVDESIFKQIGDEVRALIKEIEDLEKAIKEAIVPTQDVVDIPVAEAVIFGEGGVTDFLRVVDNFGELQTESVKKNTEARIKFAELERDEKIDAGLEYATIAGDLTNQLTGTFQQLQEVQLQSLQSKFQQGLISEQEFQMARAELLKKAAVQNKANAVFDVGLNTARAVTNALATPIPFPGPQILAALVTGLAAAQLSAVLRTPIPQFAEGTKGKKKAPKGWALVGEEGPEYVMMSGGENVFTAGDTEKLMEIFGSYGVPVQFKTPYEELYKPMTSMHELTKGGPLEGVDFNPLIHTNVKNRMSLGKKLDRINNTLVKMGTGRRMTKN